jgi:hypothetical protein
MAMATNEVTMLNALMGVALALMIALHGLRTAPVVLPSLSWEALATAEPCFVTDPTGCMLGP